MSLDRYEAQAFCTNCQYTSPVYPLVGEVVNTELCPLCRAARVVPITAPVARKALGFSEEEEQ